jgi:hypothetical protein
VNFGLELVARALPSGDFLPQSFDARNAAIQTLASENSELTFRHIEPTAMLGGVVKLQFAGDAAGFLWRKDTIQGRGSVGIEVVHDQPDSLRIRKVHINELLHLLGKIAFSALFRDINLTPTLQGLYE